MTSAVWIQNYFSLQGREKDLNTLQGERNGKKKKKKSYHVSYGNNSATITLISIKLKLLLIKLWLMIKYDFLKCSGHHLVYKLSENIKKKKKILILKKLDLGAVTD